MSKVKGIVLGIVVLIILFIAGILSMFGYLFSDVLIEEYAAIEAKALPQKNPTSYVFDGNLEHIRSKVISAVKYPEIDSPFPFKNASIDEPGYHRPNVSFYVCEAEEEICLGSDDAKTNAIFEKPENRNDLVIASDGTRMKSPVYFAAGKPLEFRMDFHVDLESIDGNKVAVTVFPINPTVYKGYGGIGLHGAILKEAFPVEATTIEEYQLLRYIGFVLGKTDMPEVVLPR
jgi:hypothetical protein